jgi:hypothetical protein
MRPWFYFQHHNKQITASWRLLVISSEQQKLKRFEKIKINSKLFFKTELHERK